MSVDVDRRVPLKVLEKLASLASRYGMLMPAFKPFVRAIYESYTKKFVSKRNVNMSYELKIEARRAIHVWRALLCSLALHEEQFARPFDSFRPNYAKYIVEFDASLNGLGVVLYEKVDYDESDLMEVAIGALSVDITFFEFGSSAKYQNTSEYIGALLGIVVTMRFLLQKGVHLSAINLRDDSKVALAWMDDASTRGSFASRAIALLALLSARQQIFISETIHIFGEENGKADKLSRKQSVLDVLGPGVPDMALIPGMSVIITRILELCNPMVGKKHLEMEFDIFWKEVIPFVDSLSNTPSII